MSTASSVNGKPKSTGKKPQAAKPSAKPASGYDWGDGRKVHTITLGQHQANRQGVQDYGVTPSTPLDAPLTSGTAYGIAQATAGRTYDPQLQANAQLQTNVPVWYQNYIARTAEAQKAQQAYAAPIVAQAQTGVENAKQTAPGLDPSSPQYALEQQAAAGRSTMAQNSANYLGGVAATNDAYLSGQGNVAARELPQVQTGLLNQYGQIQTAKQQAATEAYGQLRTQEQNAAIARQTLGLNTASAAADVDLKRGVDPVTGKPLPAEAPTGYSSGGPGLNKYGYTYDQWNALSPEAQDKKRAGTGSSAAAKDAAKKADAEKKRIAGIKDATGKIQTKISDAQSAWERYAKARKPKTTLDPTTGDPIPVLDPKTKKPVMIGATPDQIKSQLRKDKYSETEIHIMLMLRAGKKLTAADVKALKSQDPNIRIPREWLKGKDAGLARPGNASNGAGQSRPT